uniref:Uncharacterized protein n=1 Tax=Anguilla anguilla TaxID=7936 RepID=A0A0E9SAI6_ANGAN
MERAAEASIQGMQQNYSLCTESSLFHIYSLKPNKGLRDPIHKAPYIWGILKLICLNSKRPG